MSNETQSAAVDLEGDVDPEIREYLESVRAKIEQQQQQQQQTSSQQHSSHLTSRTAATPPRYPQQAPSTPSLDRLGLDDLRTPPPQPNMFPPSSHFLAMRSPHPSAAHHHANPNPQPHALSSGLSSSSSGAATGTLNANVNAHHAQTNASAGLRSSSALAQTMAAENQLLRAELQSLTAMSREQRREMERMRTEAQVQAISASIPNAPYGNMNAQIPSQPSTVPSYGQTTTIPTAAANNNTLPHHAALFSTTTNAIHNNVNLGSSGNFATATEVELLRREVQIANTQLATLSQRFETYQRELLPNYDQLAHPAFSGSLSLSQSGSLPIDSSLLSHVARIDRGLQMLRFVVDAKLETYSRMRARLKEENLALRADNERLMGIQAQSVAAVEGERSQVRADVEHLEQQYHSRIDSLRRQLDDAREAAASVNGRTESLQREVQTLREERDRALRQISDVQKEVADEENMRAVLAAELATERDKVVRLKDELEQLRLSQKYLSAVSGGSNQNNGAGVPPERLDIMRTVEKLLAENRALKLDKARLEGELVQVRREGLQQRLASTIGEREIMLAANDQTSSYDLTAKILQKNLGLAASSVGMPRPPQ
jgi:predicted  nucleic acid-binding Zn-ribbon protein